MYPAKKMKTVRIETGCIKFVLHVRGSLCRAVVEGDALADRREMNLELCKRVAFADLAFDQRLTSSLLSDRSIEAMYCI
jgi:hypothetical protein